MALPLCPSNRIEEAFELIQLEVANMSPAVAAFAEEYLNYIRATYMSGNYGSSSTPSLPACASLSRRL